jgi:hypothetical protein
MQQCYIFHTSHLITIEPISSAYVSTIITLGYGNEISQHER